MLIYIHGFAGSGRGMKAKRFKEALKGEPFLSPTLSYIPELAIGTLCELIETCMASSDPMMNDVKLIGSSLGGYYALYLSERFHLKTVLLNPALYPVKTLSRYEGSALNFYDRSCFEWNETHLKMLESYQVNALNGPERLLLLLQTGDEVLDYREALAKLPMVQAIVQEGGEHSFANIDEHFSEIERFLEVKLG